MDEGDTFCLTCGEEANDIQIDQTDVVQVECDTGRSGLYLRCQLLYVLPLNATNQSYRGRLSIRILLDP